MRSGPQGIATTKGRTCKPLIIGGAGPNPVTADVPDHSFKGEIRRLTIQRGSLTRIIHE